MSTFPVNLNTIVGADKFLNRKMDKFQFIQNS